MGKHLRRDVLPLLPDWVPQAARHYLEHTEAGLPIRALARSSDVHASTVLRQIRRYETRRDDPLIDDALRDLSHHYETFGSVTEQENTDMQDAAPHLYHALADEDENKLKQEGLRILRRLSEAGAVLALAREMEKGVVVREGADGAPQRLAIVDRDVAQYLALQDWINCDDLSARVNRYQITGAGRSALKQFMAAQENKAGGFAEGPAVFARAPGNADVVRMRPVVVDSPLSGLARRKGQDGRPFLGRDLVMAGERLREDFEISQMSGDASPVWERMLSDGVISLPVPNLAEDGYAKDAKGRVQAALNDLGPGLGDVVLRSCCYLEGMESLEKHMGWSARSGKIVLRIALQRLHRHYNEINGGLGPKIG